MTKGLKIVLVEMPLGDGLFETDTMKRAWEIVCTLDELGEEEFIGIRHALDTAARKLDPLYCEAGISSYSFRRALRELVDAGCIRVTPDPAQGNRLPD